MHTNVKSLILFLVLLRYNFLQLHMTKYILLIISFLLLNIGNGQTTVSGSFDFDGENRTYSFYVPASYTPGTPLPLVLNLHGTSTDGAYQAQYRDFRPIADTANFIVAHPDGTTLFGQRFWNYGNVFGSTVDDVGFLEALIDTISANYSIDPQRVYCTGMSNGSFMSYAMACQSNRLAAIGGVTGSMSVNMYNSCTPSYPIPVIHIHGTDDGINPYTGNSTMKAIEEVIAYWVNQNSCNTTPTITNIPDTSSTDNASAERYLYDGGVEGHTVEHFKVTGGGHTWPGSPVSGSSDNTCMDFSASIEIWRFFSQYQRSASATIEQDQALHVKIWPNPSSEFIFIETENSFPIEKATIYDMQGRVVMEKYENNIQTLDIRPLIKGTYVLKISGKEFNLTKKVTKF